MYFGRRDKTLEPEDEIVDSGDMLAKDEGSDSNDEPEPHVTKSVTFADAIETKVESKSADEARQLRELLVWCTICTLVSFSTSNYLEVR
jgi:hypothetical protein